MIARRDAQNRAAAPNRRQRFTFHVYPRSVNKPAARQKAVSYPMCNLRAFTYLQVQDLRSVLLDQSMFGFA